MCRSVPQSKTDTCRGSYTIPRVPHPSPKTDTPAASTTRHTPETVLVGQRRRLACPPRCRVSPPTPVIRLPGTHYGPRLHRPHEHCTGARGQTHGHETQTDSRRTNQTATACTHKRRSGHSYHSFSTQSSRRTLLPQLLHTELETVFRVGTEFHEIADDALDTRREDDQSLPLHAICHLGLNANDGQPTPHALARL